MVSYLKSVENDRYGGKVITEYFESEKIIDQKLRWEKYVHLAMQAKNTRKVWRSL